MRGPAMRPPPARHEQLGWNMYVFRDGKRTVSGAELISSLTRALRRWQVRRGRPGTQLETACWPR